MDSQSSKDENSPVPSKFSIQEKLSLQFQVGSTEVQLASQSSSVEYESSIIEDSTHPRFVQLK